MTLKPLPRIINGGWQLSAGHGADWDEIEMIEDLMQMARSGLTAFDCADIYTGVEALFGRFLKMYKARYGQEETDKIRIHTKYVPNLNQLKSLRREDVTATIDRSLQRLGVETLDLVQFHWWDYDVPGYVEAAGWLAELQHQGKIQALGATNFNAARLREICEAGIRIASHQVQFSLLDRRPETNMVDLCREHDMVMYCYGSLAGGFLTDRWLDRAEPKPPFENRSLVKYRLIIEEFGGWQAYSDLLRLLRTIADRHGCSIANVAGAWVLNRDRVGAIIVGARSAAHLTSNLRTADLVLTPQDLAAIDDYLAGFPGPEGDTFDLERIPDGPHQIIMKTNLG
ncbi:MAG: aldo/keto reductase [Acidobacteriota bacterium]|nr:aldo/keto reductase [Acidobacteriota bacterium]